jgi:hypothetical protein
MIGNRRVGNMSDRGHEQVEALVQIVGPTDDWILERLARRLAAKLPYARFVPRSPQASVSTRLVYYVNYALYERPSGLVDVGFFTHLDDNQQFLPRARSLDFCVCMSRLYADWMLAQGIRSIVHIPMGFDAYRYRPRLVLGVVGRLAHPRKGRHLVDRLAALPFVDLAVTEGQVAEDRLVDFYQRLDYVLIPATVEGGPMSLLEGLALGKPVIAPEDVGMVPEFGQTEHILRYPAGDGEALVRVVTACYEQKVRSTRLVQERTWDRWAAAHDHLFMGLLRARGESIPAPAAGFRFGMLGELEVPPGTAVGDLENGLDQAAAHLYYGRYPQTRALLGEVASRYPCARPLLASVPAGEVVPSFPARGTSHLKALR